MSEPAYGTPPPEPAASRPGATPQPDLYSEAPAVRPSGAPSPVSGGVPDRAKVEAKLRKQAEKNLRRRAAFRAHLVTYLIVNAALFSIWLVIAIAVGHGAWFPWFVFPALGWGVGLGIHGWATYSGDPVSEANIQAEMRRITGNQP